VDGKIVEEKAGNGVVGTLESREHMVRNGRNRREWGMGE
jgi:hypothetical protein